MNGVYAAAAFSHSSMTHDLFIKL